MEIHEIIISLFLAVVVGGLIGYEREYKNRPAGFRTHILVCVGAATVSMIQLHSLKETTNLIINHPELEGALKADIGRMGAQVITGVGFLGAGTIMHEKGSVKGLTTAASLWTVACIGLAAGLGYYTLTILSTICVYIVLVTLKKFETRFIDRTKVMKLKVQHDNKHDSVHKVTEYFKYNNIKVIDIEFSTDETEEENKYTSTLYTLIVPKSLKGDSIIESLNRNESLISAIVV